MGLREFVLITGTLMLSQLNILFLFRQ